MPRRSFSGILAQARRPHPYRHAMAFLLALAVACSLVLLTARGASGQAGEGEVDEDPGGAPYAAGELIITYEESIPQAPVARITEEVESTVEDSLPAVDAQLIEFPEVKREGSQEEREQTLEEKKEELERDPAVEAVDYNYLKTLEARPNDPQFGRQWHLGRISAPPAWNRENGDSGTRIAVIDSGIDLDHPDLRGKIDLTCDATGANVLNQGTAAACDENGDANDTDGHGTHVAGIAAAATDNGTGVAGACPDCRLMAAKVEDADGSITLFAVNSAVVWATDRGADVINMSYSGEAPAASERRAIDRAARRGVSLVASAGNESTKRARYPAAYGNVISVAATTRQDTRARYSNRGPTIDVSAPGGSSGRGNSVFSTLPGAYGNKIGTSMSSPAVAGIAGLLSSQGRSNTGIRQRIQATAVDLGPRGRDGSFGHGRVDAAAAVGARPRNTHPIIGGFRPKPGATLGARRVRVSAVVRDRQTDLRRSDITLIVDGRRLKFRYNASNGRLVRVIRVAPGKHAARIVARDGWGLGSSRVWRFSTTRR